MSDLIRKAEGVFDVAIGSAPESPRVAVVIDRAGGLRVLNSNEWSLAALIEEFGAAEVYVIDRRFGEIRVEGWSPDETCVITRCLCAVDSHTGVKAEQWHQHAGSGVRRHPGCAIETAFAVTRDSSPELDGANELGAATPPNFEISRLQHSPSVSFIV